MHKIIPITKGSGSGDTKMAAFDAALFDAGIANYNLIRLSSIIPTGFQPKIQKLDWNNKNHGNKLYVVYASHVENEMGKEAWAGIGWAMTKGGTKLGLFTEHEGASEKEVVNLINETLGCMIKHRSEEYGEVQYEVVGIRCDKKPVCAVVAAVYESEGWTTN